MATVTNPGTHVIEDTDIESEKPYHLILLDDDHHTYEYVVGMLQRIFGYSREKGFAIACMVDSAGQAILMTGSHSEVESKQSQVHAFGADPRMANSVGSMSAIIEPAA
jgi:ATP-dependent Clp protease adaptor protein ClpS